MTTDPKGRERADRINPLDVEVLSLLTRESMTFDELWTRLKVNLLDEATPLPYRSRKECAQRRLDRALQRLRKGGQIYFDVRLGTQRKWHVWP